MATRGRTRLRGYAERRRLLQEAKDGVCSDTSSDASNQGKAKKCDFISSDSSSESEESYHVVVEPRKSGLIPFRRKKPQAQPNVNVLPNEGAQSSAAASTPPNEMKYAVLDDWETENEQEPRLETRTRSHYNPKVLSSLGLQPKEADLVEAEVRRLQSKIAPGKSLAFDSSATAANESVAAKAPLSIYRRSKSRESRPKPAPRKNAKDKVPDALDVPPPRVTASPVFPLPEAAAVALSPEIILERDHAVDDEGNNTQNEQNVKNVHEAESIKSAKDEDVEKKPKPAPRSKAPKNTGKRSVALAGSDREAKKQKTPEKTPVVEPPEQQQEPLITIEPDVEDVPVDVEEQNNNTPMEKGANLPEEATNQAQSSEDAVIERETSESKRDKKKDKNEKKRKKEKKEKRERKGDGAKLVTGIDNVYMKYNPPRTTRYGRTIKPSIHSTILYVMHDHEATIAKRYSKKEKTETKTAKTKDRPPAIPGENDAQDAPAKEGKGGARKKRPAAQAKAQKAKTKNERNASEDPPTAVELPEVNDDVIDPPTTKESVADVPPGKGATNKKRSVAQEKQKKTNARRGRSAGGAQDAGSSAAGDADVLPEDPSHDVANDSALDVPPAKGAVNKKPPIAQKKQKRANTRKRWNAGSTHDPGLPTADDADVPSGDDAVFFDPAHDVANGNVPDVPPAKDAPIKKPPVAQKKQTRANTRKGRNDGSTLDAGPSAMDDADVLPGDDGVFSAANDDVPDVPLAVVTNEKEGKREKGGTSWKRAVAKERAYYQSPEGDGGLPGPPPLENITGGSPTR